MKKSQINKSNLAPKDNKKTSRAEKQAILKQLMAEMNNENKFKFWIRTLLSSYNIFPEIIKTVDKIIELQASSISFSNDVYNGSNSALSQMEKVIDLGERKNSLVNIYLMTKDMISGISKEDDEIIEKRFCLNWTASEIAKDYDLSLRTIYRKIDKIINEIYKNCKSRNWSLRLIESQVKNETWLHDRYLKNVKEYLRSTNYTLMDNNLKQQLA